MGIPNQTERLQEVAALLEQVEATPELLALLERWWVRLRPDGQACRRCVLLKGKLTSNRTPKERPL